ncbi:hypothetical protein K457DRAFT_30457 [Linnemannia elongata AG-77]|uniref:Chromosome segregation in meiosis protein 3 domain-containing protein n=1 Tax=Linnemannia elongata AG-77 TaxID=1314771 RepID=A0A197K3I8_9FUNG|nr:hypothetical protein K457DRAFT_30457 [Linnemannia elongata AG-77]
MDIDDFPDDLQLDDAAFEQFDDYDAFADEMMEIAEKADQQQQQKQQKASSTVALPSQSSVSSSASASATRASSSSGIGALPAQRDYLAMLHAQSQRVEQEVAQSQQQRAVATSAAATPAWKGAATKKGGSGGGGGWNRPIGSTSGNTGAPVEGDLATVNVAKKRAKMVRLDSEKLLGIQGFPMLMAQGKRLKIRNKHRTSAEKDANSKKNLADLMMLYQTWAHNLFPKSTFRDFILQAEAKCKSDKQIKASMNGWRDAYWDEVREKQYGVDDTERAAMAAEDRMNGVWEQHTADRAQGATGSMEQDPFLDAEKSDGQPSSSNWSFGNEGTTFATTGSSSGGFKSAQTRGRPAAASRKGKERLVDNPSASMRLQISDDEDDGGQDDYEVALSRMKNSMNLNSRSPVVQRTTSRIQGRSRSGTEAMDEDRQEPSSRISGSGVSRAGSIFDEEEEDDDEAPLFTHRALQMIGGLSALEERQRAAAAEKESNGGSSNIPGKKTSASNQRATLSSDEDEEENANNNTLAQADPSPVNLSLGSQWGFGSGGSMFEEYKNAGSGVAVKGESGLNLDDDEDDEETAMVSQRRPKARKALILEDSDDE